jgi:ABC-type uncharacterized transport system substrate-binding protein
MDGMKRIVAVAVGPQQDQSIGPKGAPSNVRRYVDGLVEGLATCGRQLGKDYEIDYRERPEAALANGKSGAFASRTPYDLVFAMSTTVVRAARKSDASTPIVGVVSDFKAEGFGSAGNVTGISARRSQSAGDCFARLLATVPALRQVLVLHKPKYKPSERSLKLVKAAAKKRGVSVKPLAIKTREDIQKKLSALPRRDSGKPAESAVLVLPVDVCFGAARVIVDIAQGQKNLPVFFPAGDFVESHGALGGYGVTQRTCGLLMSRYVDRILWGGAKPSSLKVADAGAEDFEWVVSGTAAKALRLPLPRVI